jgi:hypothetical protein
MRLLLLAVLALEAVALGATFEQQGGCDYDFGAGNGTAYLVANNPYNLKLSLNITYQIGEYKYSEVRNFSNIRVIVFCGLGNGWLYIRQNASLSGTPLVLYPLAVPRYVVLRAGESATMFVTTLFAQAVTISIGILLIVAVTLRPRLRRSAIYAVPDELRNIDIQDFILILLLIPYILLLSILIVLVLTLSPESAFTDIGSLLLMYVISSLGGFYLSFHRGLFAYYFILVGFFIDIFLLINVSKSPLALLSFILSFYILGFYSLLRTLAIALLSFYNLFMVFLLSTYGIAVFIYSDENFGHTIPWSLPSQTPAILTVIIETVRITIELPVIGTVIIPSMIMALLVVFLLAYNLAIHAPAEITYKVFWPPLWWWLGLGVFALDELSARSLLHRLSASGTVVVKLPRGERALVVSSDLYGMYLCRFGRRSGVCNNVKLVGYDELVRYDEMEVEASRRIMRSIDGDSVWRFFRKVVLPIIAGVSVLTIQHSLIFAMLIILSLVFYYIYYKKGYMDNDARELEEYIRAIKQDRKLLLKMIMTHILWSLSISSIFSLPILKELIDLILNSNRAVSWDVLALRLAIFMCVFLIAIILSVLLRADPKLSRYLFLWLELRLMSVGGLVIGLARGGCLHGTKMWAASQGSAWVIRDGDCLVVVSPYVENVKSRLKRYLCGPACPPVRVVVDEELQDLMNTRQLRIHKKQVRDVDGRRVAVGILNLRKRRYYYYIVDFPRRRQQAAFLNIWRSMASRQLGMRRDRR